MPNEICRVFDCEEAAQVIVEVQLVWMDENGVEDHGDQLVAFCRRHANAEAGTSFVADQA